jgi:formimidoylglutamate deiminase
MAAFMTAPDMLYWAPSAWVNGAWADAVLLRVGADGCWAEVTPGVTAPASAQVLAAPVLPGIVNAHSHAFQRAFVGLAERAGPNINGQADDFWSWRQRMYGVALSITPEQLRHIATHLYTELLQGGYTHVCEFHYLQHQPDGRPYPDELQMARALADAAQTTGIGLTLLPVLYERAGFQKPQLLPEQRRFATSVTSVLRLRDGIRAWQLPGVDAGVAIHSLRAASAHNIRSLAQAVQSDAGPVHIHIAEQTAEVEDCLAATGKRPIQWLTDEIRISSRWHLVHATHGTAPEIEAVARSGAGVVLCPSTEANLGDGVPDLTHWLSSGTPLSVGSDSHVTRNWPEELRSLEYTQRLLKRQRNVSAKPGLEANTAARLFNRVLPGGAAAAGHRISGLQKGARADLLVLNTQDPALHAVPSSHLLDATVFASVAQPFGAVMVAGRWIRFTPLPVSAQGWGSEGR